MAGERALTATQPQRRATKNNKSMGMMMRATMKMARTARTMVTTNRVPGNKEGKGGKGHGVGNKGGV